MFISIYYVVGVQNLSCILLKNLLIHHSCFKGYSLYRFYLTYIRSLYGIFTHRYISMMHIFCIHIYSLYATFNIQN